MRPTVARPDARLARAGRVRSSEEAAFVYIVGDADPNLFRDVDATRARACGAARAQEAGASGPDAPPRVCLDGHRMPTGDRTEEVLGTPDVDRMWEEIAAVTRLDAADPVAGVAGAHRGARVARRGARGVRVRTLFASPAPDGPRDRPPRRRSLEDRAVDDRLGAGARDEPADRGGVHDADPRGRRCPSGSPHPSTATDRSSGRRASASRTAASSRSARTRGRNSSLKVAADEGRPCGGGRPGRHGLGGRPARARVPPSPVRRERLVHIALGAGYSEPVEAASGSRRRAGRGGDQRLRDPPRHD